MSSFTSDSPDDFVVFAPEDSDDDLCSDSDSVQASDSCAVVLPLETRLRLDNLRAYIHLGLS